MIFFYLTPLFLLLNIFFVIEGHKWVDALLFIPFRLKKYIKITGTFLWGIFFIATYAAFIIPRNISRLDHPFIYQLRRLLKQLGNYHLGVSIYLGMSFLIILISRAVERVFFINKGLSKSEINNIFHSKRRAVLGLANLVFIIFITCIGLHKAKDIKVNNYEISIHKKCSNITDLNIVLLADLHMGYNIGTSQIAKTVDLVNAQNPDLVIVAGDIFDNEYEALENPELMSSLLSSINSKYGTYAVLGNHDVSEAIIAGFTFNYNDPGKGTSDEMDQFLSACNWTLLQDEYVLIDDSFYIYGRPDYEKPGKNILTRKHPAEITEGLDLCKPIFVIDHEPRELSKLAEAGVDIDMCGHTHDGQFFPMNITSRYFTWENSAGLLEKGNMKNIVTSGVGLFGPNIRIGTQAEICNIKVHFE